MIKNFISGCKDTAIFWNNKPFAKKNSQRKHTQARGQRGNRHKTQSFSIFKTAYRVFIRFFHCFVVTLHPNNVYKYKAK